MLLKYWRVYTSVWNLTNDDRIRKISLTISEVKPRQEMTTQNYQPHQKSQATRDWSNDENRKVAGANIDIDKQVWIDKKLFKS